MLESKYQSYLIKKIGRLFPGCMVLKNDTRQGMPDLLVLYRSKWAALEVKPEESSRHQPNQDWYVNEMDAMSFAAFIFPENEEEVLDALQQALRPRRLSRVS